MIALFSHTVDYFVFDYRCGYCGSPGNPGRCWACGSAMDNEAQVIAGARWPALIEHWLRSRDHGWRVADGMRAECYHRSIEELREGIRCFALDDPRLPSLERPADLLDTHRCENCAEPGNAGHCTRCGQLMVSVAEALHGARSPHLIERWLSSRDHGWRVARRLRVKLNLYHDCDRERGLDPARFDGIPPLTLDDKDASLAAETRERHVEGGH